MTSAVPYAEVIGDPIEHSKSPLIHSFWLGKLGLAHDYRATRVAPDKLEQYLRDRRVDPQWCGCNVTMPLKTEVPPFTDELSDEARRIGAVNTLIRTGREGRLVGHNTDWLGVREPLRDWIESERVLTVSVIGTGGAAAAAILAVLRRRPGTTQLLNYGRTLESARAFRLRLDEEEYASAPISDLRRASARGDEPELLINASPLGMRGHPPLEIDLDFLTPGSTVFDMVYEPLETELLQEAQRRGLRVVDGLTMLVAQAAAAFELFFCAPAPREHDDELRELLTA